MAMTKHARKYATGLAGEFLVAGELLRRGVMAAVTYGNAKKADVVAFRAGRAVTLEVKSTSEAKWILGDSLPDDAASLWVLVFLPADTALPPEYFVLTSGELRDTLLPHWEAYMSRYVSKHGREFAGKGVVSVQREWLGASHRGAWHKAINALGLEAPSEVAPVATVLELPVRAMPGTEPSSPGRTAGRN